METFFIGSDNKITSGPLMKINITLHGLYSPLKNAKEFPPQDEVTKNYRLNVDMAYFNSNIVPKITKSNLLKQKTLSLSCFQLHSSSHSILLCFL